MKYEKFQDGTGEKGKYVSHHDGMDRTTSSEGNRKDAHQNPADKLQFKSWSDEYSHLTGETQRLEATLAELASQMKLRQKQHMAAGRPMSEWVKIEAEMLEQRQRVIADRIAVNDRIREVKGRALRERRQQNGSFDRFEVQIALLTEIRDLLQDIKAIWS